MLGNHMIVLSIPFVHLLQCYIIQFSMSGAEALQEQMSEVDVVKNLKTVLGRLYAASAKRPPELQFVRPRLVAVSKKKPVEMILAAYKNGHRHFAENYVQELLDKSMDPEILENCKDIRWHFIGHVQRNKIKKIVKVKNLYMLETVDSKKTALDLDNAWGRENPVGTRLNVMVQINTSGERGKNGADPKDLIDLTDYVTISCPNLKFAGLMTIGKFGRDLSEGPNPDFLKLRECRDEVNKTLGIPIEEIELSMGMSNDFEHAIELGSTSVRVGTLIFGARTKAF